MAKVRCSPRAMTGNRGVGKAAAPRRRRSSGTLGTGARAARLDPGLPLGLLGPAESLKHLQGLLVLDRQRDRLLSILIQLPHAPGLWARGEGVNGGRRTLGEEGSRGTCPFVSREFRPEVAVGESVGDVCEVAGVDLGRASFVGAAAVTMLKRGGGGGLLRTKEDRN